MAHTCRGTINLANAFIHTEDSCSFVISNGGTQTFHLKASSEVERQRWVTALELAKAQAISLMESGRLSLTKAVSIAVTTVGPEIQACEKIVTFYTVVVEK